ncbi:hypothetical protein Fmac_018014 [Flemingia macrophylla]|uniref:Uncharacterized protein n=1 Tax=Flemingia macrophylla TaxID=520843 RepID=A0ABD1M3T5_9FABA
MGGKGKRRREKNYRAAHGGYSGLPPPPKASQLDALPSKLRKIMSFTHQQNGAIGSSKNNCNYDGHAQNNAIAKDRGYVGTVDVKLGNTNEELKAPLHLDKSEEQIMESGAIDKKKKKRKRKEVKDLRFAIEVDKTKSQFKRKDRRKKYLESKKKHKKPREEELDFPGHEKIKFGDIVQAPPKLTVPSKASLSSFRGNFWVLTESKQLLALQNLLAYKHIKYTTQGAGRHLPSLANGYLKRKY